MDNHDETNEALKSRCAREHERERPAAHHRELWVRDVMNSHVISVTANETIASAAQAMSQHHISCLAVVDNGVFKGLITQETLLNAIFRQSSDMKTQTVGACMLRAVPVISPEMTVLEASRIAYSENFKWLPVLSGKRLVGIVTQTDLVQVLMCLDGFPDVASIMSRDAISIAAGSSAADAARVMAENRISCVVAVQNERVLGILTEKDLLRTALESQKDPAAVCVVDIMSFPVIAARPSDSMISASRLMERMRLHHLAVMDGEQLCGIITRSDVLNAFQQSLGQYAGLHASMQLSES